MTTHEQALEAMNEYAARNLPYFDIPNEHLAGLISAYLAARNAVVMEWQPIETAPRDGREILVWGEYQQVATARYSEWEKRFVASWEDSSVIEYQGDFGTDYKTLATITHWMPLPAPPALVAECERRDGHD